MGELILLIIWFIFATAGSILSFYLAKKSGHNSAVAALAGFIAPIIAPVIYYALPSKKDDNKDRKIKNKKRKETENPWYSFSLSKTELERQVNKYHDLKMGESVRGVLILIIAFVVVGLGLLLSLVSEYATPGEILIDVIFYAFILYFVYKGHRWALISLFVWYTIALIYSIYSFNRFGIGTILWSIAIYAYIVKSYKVENARKKKKDKQTIKNVCISCNKTLGKDSPFCSFCGKKGKQKKADIYCKQCGEKNDNDAKFCSGCGNKI